MKLQNKETGKPVVLRRKIDGRVVEDYDIWININDGSVDLDYSVEGRESKSHYHYKTFEMFKSEWEDYEEPETYYIVGDLGNIESSTNDHGHNLPEEIWHKVIKRRKEIGNYFETKEEAEKAVEKLKAWKRLKDKDFKFDEWKWNISSMRGMEIITIKANIKNLQANFKGNKADLDLLFGVVI